MRSPLLRPCSRPQACDEARARASERIASLEQQIADVREQLQHELQDMERQHEFQTAALARRIDLQQQACAEQLA